MLCKSNLLAASFLVLFLLDATAEPATKTGHAGLHPDSNLIELKADNWQLMLQGEWMIGFFAPYSKECEDLADTWKRFAHEVAVVPVKVAKIDVSTSPSLSERFWVNAVPTIYHVKDGEFREYQGARCNDALLQFVKKQLWQDIEPLSGWRKPNTIHMSILGYFAKVTNTLKDIKERLQERGLHFWLAYILVAIGSMIVGAAVGTIFMWFMDYVNGIALKTQRKSYEFPEKLVESVEDLVTKEDDQTSEQQDNKVEKLEEKQVEEEENEDEHDEGKKEKEECKDQSEDTSSEEEFPEKVRLIGDSESEKPKKKIRISRPRNKSI